MDTMSSGGGMSDAGMGFPLDLEHQHHHPHHHSHHQQHHQQSHHHLDSPHSHSMPESPQAYERAYFGKDMFTFAGRLFWDCMTYNFLRTQRLQAGNAARIEQCQESEVYTMCPEDQEMMAAMARTRLRYKDPQPDAFTKPAPSLLHREYMRANNQSSFPLPLDTAQHLYMGRCAKSADGSLISHEVVTSSHWWKTPSEVEAYVRQGLTEAEYRLVEDPLTGRDTSEESETRIRLAMQALVPNAIYFPDGPRWSFIYLSMVVGTWVRDLRGGGMAVGE